MSNLGYQHEKGLGVAHDESAAAQLYRKSAEAGDPTAMNNLGSLYENGQGVERNLREAAGWYRKAAELGYPPAMYNLGRTCQRKICDERRVAPDGVNQAVHWYQLAADRGYDAAKNNLGYLYQYTFKDYAKARALYTEAEASEDREVALKALKLLKELNTPRPTFTLGDLVIGYAMSNRSTTDAQNRDNSKTAACIFGPLSTTNDNAKAMMGCPP